MNGNYNSGFPFDVAGSIRQKEYALLNAELSLEPAKLNGLPMSLWGRNLTSHDYIQGALPTNFADLVSWAAPVTYALTAQYRF